MKKRYAVASITDEPLHLQYQEKMVQIFKKFLSDLDEEFSELEDSIAIEDLDTFIRDWVEEHFP